MNLIKRINRPKILQAILLIAVIVSGSLYIRYAWNSSIDETSKQAQKIATAAEVSLNGEMLKKLNASPDDIGTTAYESIKKRLMELVNINSEIRFAYFYTQKAGKIYIMADSEPVDSEDYSPPGQEYSEADVAYFKPFEDGQALITKPVTDRWGTWISVLVPLKDSKTGKVTSVFGMDYPSKIWSSNALAQTTKAGVVVVTLLLLILAFYKLLNTNKIIKEEKYRLNSANNEIINVMADIKKSEEKFSTAFQSGAVLMTISRIEDGCFIDANEAFLKTLGFKREEVIGRTSADLELFADKGQRALIKKIFDAEGRVSNLETLVKGRDGFIYTGILSVDPIDAEDAPCWLITMTDITQRKRAEDLLIQTRQNYEIFFNSIDDFLFVLDAQGNMLHVNTTVIERLGYTREELLGISVLMIHPPERRDEAGRIVGEMLAGTAEFCPVPIITKSGVYIPVETRVAPGIWDGKPVLFGVTKDISKIKASEEKFSKLFHINPSACGLSDLENHKYIEVNDAFYTLLGFDKDEVIGRTATDLGILTAETISAIVLKANKDGNTTNVEADLKAKNGDIKHALLSSENIYVQDKKYRFTVVQDITDRKKAEVELKHSEESLNRQNSLLSSLLKNLPVGVFMVEAPSGRPLIVNDAACNMLGQGILPDVSGGNIAEVYNASKLGSNGAYPPEEQPLLLGMQGKTTRVDDMVVERPDGKKTLLEVFGSPVTDEQGKIWASLASFLDITDRKKAEVALQKSEDRHRGLVENSHDIIYTLGTDGVFTFVSPAWTALLGHPVSQVDGHSFQQFVHPDDLEGCMAWLQKVIRTGQRQEGVEYRVHHIDGSWRWHTSSAVPLKDGGGTIIGFEGTARDITERKKADMALRDSESLQRLLTDSISAGIIIVDTHTHTIEQANPYAARLFGCPEEQIVGQICHNFICPAQIGSCPITDKGQEVDNSDRVLLCANGSQMPILKSVKRIQIRGEEKLLETFIDITERKLAEKALEQIAARLELATRAGGVGVWDYDIVNNNLLWDDQMFLLYGIDKNDFSHAYSAWQAGLHPDDVKRGDEEIQMAISGEKEFDTEFRVIWADGSVHILKARAVVKRDDSGQALRMIGTNWDITEQKQAEQELVKAKEQAEAATIAKSEFLANMSHEIRTPMNAIIGFSGLIRKTDMTPKQKDYTNKIDSSAKSLLGIINDILDFSKIEAGKLEMESVDFNLDDVISNILGMISVKTSEKNIELLNNISSEVPLALNGDPLRLGQVLVNLSNNAVKFTQKGHILLKTELVSKDDTSCRIKFSVSDTGIGMTPEQISKLFSAFSQADSSVTRRFGGTGLGLTISKRLVEIMDGEISAESKFGSGSTFTFTAGFKMQAGKKEHRTVDSQKLSKLKVLVADDNEMARDILKKQLASFGINACMVDSGPAAIAEIKKQSSKKPYDLVFMDRRMPGMDGLQTAKEITGGKDMGRVPKIVIVTAFEREEVVKQAEKIGINAFLMKPVNQSLLFDTIMNVFGLNTAESLIRTANKNDTADLTDTINGARILLVEDNILNQEVATEILKSAGAIVDIAGNGMRAVEAVMGFHYDIVLMDLQMPVMGGYEATGLIRSNEKYKDLPIIAMTAHAMAGAKEECLAAGLNDYVSKPIEPQQLFSVIRKWIKRAEGSINRIKKTDKPTDSKDRTSVRTSDTLAIAIKNSIGATDADKSADITDKTSGMTIQIAGIANETSNSANVTTGANAASYSQSKTAGEIMEDIELPESIPGVDIPSGLKRLNGNRKLYRKLLIDFSKSYSLLPQEMAGALKQDNAGTDTALRLAHTLKGVAGNISAWHIQSIAAELEAAISQNASENYEGLLAELGMALKSFDKSLKDLAQKKKTRDQGQSINAEHLLQDAETTLRKLAGLVWEDNVDAEICLEELKGCISGSEFGKEIQELAESIGSFDFEAAKEPLKRIAGKMNVELRGK